MAMDLIPTITIMGLYLIEKGAIKIIDGSIISRNRRCGSSTTTS